MSVSPWTPNKIGDTIAAASGIINMPTQNDARMSIETKAAYYGPLSDFCVLDTGDGETPLLVDGFPTVQITSARSGDKHKIQYNSAARQYECACTGGKTHGRCWHMIWFTQSIRPVIDAWRAQEAAWTARATSAQPVAINAIQCSTLTSLISERDKQEAKYNAFCEEATAASNHYQQVLSENKHIYALPYGQRDPEKLKIVQENAASAMKAMNTARQKRNDASVALARLNRRIAEQEVLGTSPVPQSPIRKEDFD